MVEIKGQITEKGSKKGTNQFGQEWERFAFTINGQKFSTFNSEHSQFEAGDWVDVDYEKSGQFNNIKTMSKIDPIPDSRTTTSDTKNDIVKPVDWDGKDLRSAMQTGVNNAVRLLEVIGLPEGTTRQEAMKIVKELTIEIKDIIYAK